MLLKVQYQIHFYEKERRPDQGLEEERAAKVEAFQLPSLAASKNIAWQVLPHKLKLILFSQNRRFLTRVRAPQD